MTFARTPRQAHLQGTQSRHTKANLAKEPACSDASGRTLNNYDIHLVDTC